MGDSRSILEAAVQALDEMKNTKVEKVSTFITTPPYGVTNQPDFFKRLSEAFDIIISGRVIKRAEPN